MAGKINEANHIDDGPDSFSPRTVELIRASSEHFDPFALRSSVALRLLQLERETRALKRVHNDTEPSCRSPPEILSQIFLALAASCRQAHQDNISWVAVTHVCRRWRDVSLHCPGLWSVLPTRYPRALKAFLDRSGNAPIAVTYDGYYPAAHQVLAEALASNIHRLSHLSIFARAGGVVGGLLPFTGSAPLLKTLELSTNGTDNLPPGFLSMGAPSLTHLLVSGCTFIWDELPISPSLLLLELQRERGLPSVRSSPASFIVSLHRLSLLRVLTLENILPDPSDFSQISSPSSIELPELTTLRVLDSIERVQRLLELASFPKISDVQFDLDHDDEQGFQQLISAFKKSCHDYRTGRPFDNQIAAYECSGHGTIPGPRIELLLWKGDHDCHAFLSLRVIFLDWKPTLRDLYTSLETQFDWTVLSGLKIGESLELDEDEWQTMFGHLPNLRHVVFDGRWLDFDPLFTLLLTLKTDRQGSEGGDVSRAVSWFPALSTIRCERSRFPTWNPKEVSRFTRRLSDAVAYRNENLPPLELHISMCQNFTSKDKVRFEEGVPNLKVVWDAWPEEGESSRRGALRTNRTIEL